jgi:hypothetical protein
MHKASPTISGEPTAPVPTRPICPNLKSPTLGPSKYIHKILYPIQTYYTTSSQRSILKNSRQLIDELDKLPTFDFKPICVSADVTSLYPNIPIDIGLLDIRWILQNPNTQHIINDKLHIKLIITLLDFVLHNCYIEFDGKYYLQIKGTAMGTSCAVVYSNLVMIWHHTHVMKLYNNALFKEYKLFNRHYFLFYGRFIDDIMALFRKKLYAKTYIKCFNQLVPTIQIEDPQISDSHINILDLTVYVCETDYINDKFHYTLLTRLYTKPCNKFIYLPPSSFHRTHIFNNWVRNEFIRMRIICSENVYYIRFANIFKHNLLKRGYEQQLITNIYNSIPDRVTLIYKPTNTSKPSSNSTNNPLTLCTTYSITTANIVNQSLLAPSNDIKFFEPLTKELHSIKPRIVFKNQPNLLMHLSKIKLTD